MPAKSVKKSPLLLSRVPQHLLREILNKGNGKSFFRLRQTCTFFDTFISENISEFRNTIRINDMIMLAIGGEAALLEKVLCKKVKKLEEYCQLSDFHRVYFKYVQVASDVKPEWFNKFSQTYKGRMKCQELHLENLTMDIIVKAIELFCPSEITLYYNRSSPPELELSHQVFKDVQVIWMQRGLIPVDLTRIHPCLRKVHLIDYFLRNEEELNDVIVNSINAMASDNLEIVEISSKFNGSTLTTDKSAARIEHHHGKCILVACDIFAASTATTAYVAIIGAKLENVDKAQKIMELKAKLDKQLKRGKSPMLMTSIVKEFEKNEENKTVEIEEKEKGGGRKRKIRW